MHNLEPLWSPAPSKARETAMFRFLQHMQNKTPIVNSLDDLVSAYAEFHQWSVANYAEFWREFLLWSGIAFDGTTDPVVNPPSLPEARFFNNVTLNFAQNLLRFDDDSPALVTLSESKPAVRLSYRQLRFEVSRIRQQLVEIGVTAGDRIAGFLPNTHEAVIAMLATTSLGAIWSSCSPDFGSQGVLDRFLQIKPRVLFACASYQYNGKTFDCSEKLSKIISALPSLDALIITHQDSTSSPLTTATSQRVIRWQDIDCKPHLDFVQLPFNHPLYIMYSSGTTGVPKCIVHGAGGTLLQHAKELLLHSDLRRQDNIAFFTTCGWMMWNWLVSALFVGSTVTLIDGSPSYPSLHRLWEITSAEGLTHLGTSPKFLSSCRTAHIGPQLDHNQQPLHFEKLRVILSTGSPLLPEDFEWVYRHVKSDLQLSSISGGTDIISCFMLGNPILPVYSNEIQCLGLGMDVAAYINDANDNYKAVIGDKGELVCKSPFPSMPVGFWLDDDGQLFRKAYFSKQEHTWFHGDYIAITATQRSRTVPPAIVGGIVVYGRSDATLNPGGVRIGTAEIYRLVEALPDVADSLVVGQPHQGDVRIVLFVKLQPGHAFNDELEKQIRATIRHGATPRHVPQVVLPVDKIPYTISGKKVELAVLEVIQGREPRNKDALADPSALDCYRDLQALRA